MDGFGFFGLDPKTVPLAFATFSAAVGCLVLVVGYFVLRAMGFRD